MLANEEQMDQNTGDLKIYVWDRCWAGAFIIVANSAQAAADKWNAKYPQGINTRHGIVRASAEMFDENQIHEVVTTEGDC